MNDRSIYIIIVPLLMFSLLCKNKSEIPERIQKKLFEANIAFLDKNFDTVIDITKSIEKEYPEYINNRLLMGKTYYYTKKFENAETCFSEILEEYPEHQEAMLWMGRVYALFDNTLDKAEFWFNKALNNHPSDYQVHLLLANVSQRQGNLKQALMHYEYSLRSEQDLLTSYKEYENLLKIAKLSEREEKIRKKRETLEKIISTK